MDYLFLAESLLLKQIFFSNDSSIFNKLSPIYYYYNLALLDFNSNKLNLPSLWAIWLIVGHSISESKQIKLRNY